MCLTSRSSYSYCIETHTSSKDGEPEGAAAAPAEGASDDDGQAHAEGASDDIEEEVIDTVASLIDPIKP